ncbi:MAG: response regulator transcription factor [Deltaproteobacteria bacterium]|jgi:DNA-binding response OmpR family regulator|nr:response regulator transcription factor [Deltaproteobacteria bacterium]
MKNVHILIAEDDKNTATLIETYLNREGFKTTPYQNGKEALVAAQKQTFDLVILDIMLPELDGWEICRELRKVSDVPILMLTAREEEIDRVLGLSLGADDYVVKPFSPREVVERVKAILRRTNKKPERQPCFKHGGLELDFTKRKVLLDGQVVDLTAVEYKILHALMSMPGKAFSRDDLLNHIYNHGEAVIDRVVDVHIGHLRQKLGDDPSAPRFIETVRGFGYRFVEGDDE